MAAVTRTRRLRAAESSAGAEKHRVSWRHWSRSRSPSKAPTVTLVLPTSRASSMRGLGSAQGGRKFLDRRGRLHELGALVDREVQLHDLLDAALAELDGHADEQAL